MNYSGLSEGSHTLGYVWWTPIKLLAGYKNVLKEVLAIEVGPVTRKASAGNNWIIERSEAVQGRCNRIEEHMLTVVGHAIRYWRHEGSANIAQPVFRRDADKRKRRRTRWRGWHIRSVVVCIYNRSAIWARCKHSIKSKRTAWKVNMGRQLRYIAGGINGGERHCSLVERGWD